MNLRLPFLLGALCLLPVSCQDDQKPAQKNKPSKKKEKTEEEQKKSLINVPAGAVMTDMVFPYYDELKKISLMTIEELTVSDDSKKPETLLAAKNVKLWLFDETGAIRSTTTISEADYFLEKEELRAEGEILMIGADNKFAVKSVGGIFSLKSGQALLLGPITTRLELPKKEPKEPKEPS